MKESVTIYTDNSKIQWIIYGKIDTANYFDQDAVAQIVIIRKRIKEATIGIKVE